MERNTKHNNKRAIAVAMIFLTAVLLIVLVPRFFTGEETRADYEVKRFSSMCSYEGKVYSGANGIYGEPITQPTSIFTIDQGKIYYVEKITEAFESMTDELCSLYRENPDGSGRELLVEDVFLPGMGNEVLIGDKLFYAYGYNEEHQFQFACYDLNSGKREILQSDKISQILGYDGSYVYYNGYDSEKEENILGRIRLETKKEETLHRYAAVDEVGYIESVQFYNGSFYCLTLKENNDSYDYRTYLYSINVLEGGRGTKQKELLELTGSANYSFLITGDMIYYSGGGNLRMMSVDGSGESRLITEMKPEEYWGIPKLVPGDGYFYYEAIADVNEETGNNDYFYRVPLTGGSPELLKEWYTL